MISLKELNPKGFPLTPVQEANLNILLIRINRVREKWGKPMIVTSGFRSMEDHKRIYTENAKKNGVTNFRIPMGSRHLSAQACDISDPDGSLFDWTKANEQFLSDVGLWMEEKDSYKRVHFQTMPPASGKRWFKP